MTRLLPSFESEVISQLIVEEEETYWDI